MFVRSFGVDGLVFMACARLVASFVFGVVSWLAWSLVLELVTDNTYEIKTANQKHKK
jgi:hypothetical protein